jgi:hypothetical protein
MGPSRVDREVELGQKDEGALAGARAPDQAEPAPRGVELKLVQSIGHRRQWLVLTKKKAGVAAGLS